MGKRRCLFAGEARLYLAPSHQGEETDPVSLLEDGVRRGMDSIHKHYLDFICRYPEPTNKLANRGTLGEFHNQGAPVPVWAEFG